MLSSIFQQRYQSDKGLIVVAQEGLSPVEGEAVYLEGGEPAPDGVYLIPTAEQYRYIEVREGMVHYYYQRKKETGTSAGATFAMILIFFILLFIIFRVMGRQY